MKRLLCILIFVVPLVTHAAESSQAVIERLIATAWQPDSVRVEWTFTQKAPAALGTHSDWALAEPRPLRAAGAIILALERMDAKSGVQRTTVSGVAKIFGRAYTAIQSIPAGKPVTEAELARAELEWTHLTASVAQRGDLSPLVVATHSLVPGRPLVKPDLKAAPIIKQGQPVDLQCCEGSVRIRLAGRALKDGAPGDVIPVSVSFEKPRRFMGKIIADGRLELAR